MHKSKAISLLKTFTSDEFKEFGLFVNSPFFNKEIVQIKLYDLLRKYYPDFDSAGIEKEKIYGKLYPEKKYSDGAMRNIISDMLALLEEFIKITGFKKDVFYSDYFLLKSLGEKEQKILFARTKDGLNNELDKLPKDAEYFYKKALIEIENRLLKTGEKDSLIKTDDNEELILNYLVTSFIIRILYRNTSLLNSNKNIFDYNYHISFINEIESYLSKDGNELINEPYINYYYNSFKLLQTGDEKYFFELNDFLLKGRHFLSTADTSTLYNLLINYSYGKLTEGHEQFMKELFALYKARFESGIYKAERTYLRHSTFLSTVTCGLEEGEFVWVENFMSKYFNEVQEEFREDTENMSLAIYFYWKKDYAKSLEHLSTVTSDDMAFKFNTKSLYLKLYFDLNESEPFYSHVDTFRHFYSNNKLVSERYSELLGNYVNYAKKLFAIQNEPDKADEFEFVKLKKELADNKSLINKSWLINRADRIEGLMKIKKPLK